MGSLRVAVHYGLGRHIFVLGLPQLVKFSKSFFATTIIFDVAVTPIKLSALVFYHRIIPVRRFTIACVVVGLLVIAWLIGCLFAQFFTCIPLAYNWDKSIPGGHCIDERKLAYYVGSAIRIPMVKKLKITDVTYTSVDLSMWINVGILSVSLPLMRPVLSKVFPSAFRTRFTSKRGASRYTNGSQRLQDGKLSIPPTHMSSRSAGDAYGGARKHKFWFNNAPYASRNDETISDGSQEDMVPMGQIAVKHDVTWQEGDGLRDERV
ncbi:MAG: hypothetical protein Q9191_005130 [Dirinaria sp. TL-2023a]